MAESFGPAVGRQPVLRQESIEPGESREVDGQYFDRQGNPIRLRIVAGACPQVSAEVTTGGLPVVPRELLDNKPPASANLVTNLFDALRHPNIGVLHLTDTGASPVFQLEGELDLPGQVEGVQPEFVVQATTLEQAPGAPANRFEVTVAPTTDMAGTTRALIMLFPDAPE